MAPIKIFVLFDYLQNIIILSIFSDKRIYKINYGQQISIKTSTYRKLSLYKKLQLSHFSIVSALNWCS